MKYLFIILYFSIFGDEIADLQNELRLNLDPKKEVDIYNKAAYSFVDSLPSLSKEYINKSFDILEGLDYQVGLARTLKINGIILARNGAPDQALIEYQKSTQIWKELGNVNEILSCIYNQSIVEFDKQNFDKADSILNSAIEEYSNTQSYGFINIYMQLGFVYYEVAKYEDALNVLHKARNLANSYKDNDSYFTITSKISTYYRKLGQFHEAIKLDKIIFNYFKSENSYKRASYSSNVGYSYLYIMEEDSIYADSAKKYLTIALDLYKSQNNKISIANSLLLISSVYAFKDQIDSTISMIKNSLEISLLEQYKKGIINCYDLLSGYYYTLANNPEEYISKNHSIKKQRKYYYLNSLEYGKKTLELIKGTRIDTFVYYPTYQTISVVYDSLTILDSSFRYLKEYLVRLEKVRKEETNESITSILSDHSIELRNKELEIKQLELNEKTTQSLILISASVLLLLAILIIFFLYKRNSELLLKILPKKIANKLWRKDKVIAEHHKNVAIVFIDMVGFSSYSRGKSPEDIIELLNDVFKEFDIIAKKYKIEKIKTIGDCYLAAAGVPDVIDKPSTKIADFTLEVFHFFENYKSKDGWNINFRAGIDVGEIVAGIIGEEKFLYDIWGEPVNTASAMEEASLKRKIHVTDNFARKIENNYIFEDRGFTEVKGKGLIRTHFLISSKRT